MRKFAVLTLCAISVACAQQNYQPGPDSQPHDGVPKGKVTSGLVLAPGKYYPGIPHNYSTYVPAQYDPAKAIAFMIFMDGGNGGRTPVVFDNLIAKGDIPPMIGIFVDPGVLPNVSDTAQNRYNRIFEYDNISDRFSKFLLEELIPEVGRTYNLSKNPDDHALGGTSTGAVGAFVAAWHRPDQFHRVLSWIGTYVSMKGADFFPAAIRRTEPKPIRIFLQDGKNDHISADQPFGVFYGGSWPLNNELMYQAFQFAGYDARLEIGDGGHDGRQAGAMMPEALRWLWRGYPQPIVVHEPPAIGKPGWEPRGQVYAIVSASKPWEKVGAAHQSLTAPSVDKDGNAFYADRANIYKADAAGKESVFKENAAGLSSVRVGADGRLYAADLSKKRILSYGPSGDEKVVVSGVTANDLALTSKNEIYFVDTAAKSVGYIDAAGKKRMMPTEISKPAALSLTTDQAMVLVGDGDTRYSWSYQILKDGSIGNGEPFYRLDLPDAVLASDVAGVTVDTLGQVYFADASGIQVCEQNGRCGALLAKPESGMLSGIAFTSAKDGNFLYASEGGQLYRRPAKLGGAAVGSPVKPPKPPL